MTEERLLEFIEQIAVCEDLGRIQGMLLQLLEILKNTGADEKHIFIVEQMIKNDQELRAFAPKARQGVHLTHNDIIDMRERGEARRKREEEARLHGRC